MEDLLISTLEKFGYPVRLQGSLLADEPYPPHFFTFWNDATQGTSFYSNEEGSIIWEFSVNYFSIDPNLVNTMLLRAKTELKRVGFIVSGAGYSVMSDEASHTGRGMSVVYIQNTQD